jgi:hypothetical protein
MDAGQYRGPPSHAAHAGPKTLRKNFAPKILSFAHHLIVKPLTVWRNVRLAVAALDHGRVAGVLLGKTSLNSLYGLMGELPQTVPQFLAILIRPISMTCGGAE